MMRERFLPSSRLEEEAERAQRLTSHAEIGEKIRVLRKVRAQPDLPKQWFSKFKIIGTSGSPHKFVIDSANAWPVSDTGNCAIQ